MASAGVAPRFKGPAFPVGAGIVHVPGGGLRTYYCPAGPRPVWRMRKPVVASYAVETVAKIEAACAAREGAGYDDAVKDGIAFFRRDVTVWD